MTEVTMTALTRQLCAEMFPDSMPVVGMDAARRAAKRNRLPDLAPADEGGFWSAINLGERLESTGIQLSNGAAVDEPTDFREREETRSSTARLTVYALNGAVMLFAFPVGFGLLIFNILGGENLRTTAHAMALTGMAVGLATTELGASVLTLV